MVTSNGCIAGLTTTEEMKLNREILEEANEILSEHLEPREIIKKLRHKRVLNDGDVQAINGNLADDERIDKMVEILKRKPRTAYSDFMAVLIGVNPDLYCDVRRIEVKVKGIVV